MGINVTLSNAPTINRINAKLATFSKIRIKVKTDSYSGQINSANKNIIKDQLPQLPIEFVLNRSVDFGEF